MSNLHMFLIVLCIIAALMIYICTVMWLVDKFGYRIYKKFERLEKKWKQVR
jgi:hypothetical protein